MRRYMIERTDGQTDHILAESISIEDKVVYFVSRPEVDSVFTYVLSNIIRIVDLGEEKEDEKSEEPERRKNDNEDLISRSGLLNYLKSHWTHNILEVIQSFEKAEYLD